MYSFAFFSGFSGASFFDSFSLATYNVFYTAVPIVFYATDKDVGDANLMNNPQLYADSRNGTAMNYKTILYWYIRSLIQAVVIFFMIINIFDVQSDGKPVDFSFMSIVMYGLCVMIQSMTILMESK